MNCHTCDRPANGLCRFCGRGICKDHEEQSSYILNMDYDSGNKAKIMVVENALRCKKCNPIEEVLEVDLETSKVRYTG